MDIEFIGMGAMGAIGAIGAGMARMLDAGRGRMGEAVDAGLGDKDGSAMADYTLGHAK